jgi:hypothetical protein
MTPLRPSLVSHIETAGTTILQLLVGLLFLAGGVVLAGYAFTHEQHVVGYVGIGVAVFGALILPGLFTVVRPILVFAFPNGLPLVGGKRKDDPPAAGPQG